MSFSLSRIMIWGPAGLLQCESFKPEGGPVSQMELHYDDEEEEEQERSSVSAKPAVSDKSVVQSTARPECSEDAQWDAGAVVVRCMKILKSLRIETFVAGLHVKTIRVILVV